MDFPITPEFWWRTDILSSSIFLQGVDQEILPCGQGRIDSAKINPSLLMILNIGLRRYLHLSMFSSVALLLSRDARHHDHHQQEDHRPLHCAPRLLRLHSITPPPILISLRLETRQSIQSCFTDKYEGVGRFVTFEDSPCHIQRRCLPVDTRNGGKGRSDHFWRRHLKR